MTTSLRIGLDIGYCYFLVGTELPSGLFFFFVVSAVDVFCSLSFDTFVLGHCTVYEVQSTVYG